MIVTLISENEIYSIALPPKKEGQYWLKKIISIEGIDGKWILKSNKKTSIIDYGLEKQELYKIELEPLKIYHLKNSEYDENYIVFTEPVTDDRQTYQKLKVLENTRITIGRNDSNNILFKNQFASSKHAQLIYKDKNWYIQDCKSSNGVFVNNKRINSKHLNLGDVIYIMGFKIIIGTDFFAFNNPDGNVSIKSGQFKDFEPQKYKKFLEDDDYDDEIEEDYFYISPRFKREIEVANFDISSAPKGQNGEEMPASLVLGPSITMGMGSMISAVTSLATFQIPAALTSIGMIGGSMIWPSLTRKYQKKILDEKEKERQEKYTKYLEILDKQIDEEIAKQKEILEENFISIQKCAELILNKDISLWNRTFEQNDFLKLRVGKGETPLNANVNYQKKQFDLNADNLDDAMLALAEEPKIIKDVPIIISFLQAYMSGIIGKRDEVVAFAKGLILQMMTYYSYDEIKMVFLYDENEESEFEFVKWLPHTWNNQKTFRFVATNTSELKEITVYFEKEISNRKELNEEELKEQNPYYVVFALSKDLTIRSDLVKRLTAIKKNLHISLITFYDELRYIPKECSTVIELNSYNSKIYNKYDTSGTYIKFEPDILIKEDLKKLSLKLADLKLDLEIEGDGYNLPKLITFLELYNVGKIEHLNIFTRWQNSDPIKTLEAPIGLNVYGDTFYLDFHQEYDGPHGLVAGTTGSGKSEFLMTFILSLAVNFRPEEVSFVLIDYKGGGMAKAFENLPHVQGIITDLDKSDLGRAITSLRSELIRRQEIFNNIMFEQNLSSFEIYDYQRLYREGKLKNQLSHLFIITDEFAELKSQHPEIMSELISIARKGRSLGIHLILATQKPSGIVDEEIKDNAHVRICLKVQSKSDSTEMLGSPDAVDIQDTGRIYLKTKRYPFEICQSAWAGATYIPQEKINSQNYNVIQIIDKIGRVLKECKIQKQTLEFENKKQLKAITNYIEKIANEENIKLSPIWLPKIPEEIYIEDLENKYNINYNSARLEAFIGEYDDPEKQRQMPLYLPLFNNENYAILGMYDSGKSMFITTMLYSVLKNYNSKDVGFYILDFDTELLKVFSRAPHVGDVVLCNEKEKIEKLFKLLQEEWNIRKKILSDYAGSLEEYNKETENKIQKIFIIIHNYELFREYYGENYEDTLIKLSKDARKYGIYFVITANSQTGIKSKVLENFSQITLQMQDEFEYLQTSKQNVKGEKSVKKIYPARYKGRGIINLNNDIYEFQVARIVKNIKESTYLKEFCENLRESNTFITKKIPILPEIVDKNIIEPYLNMDINKIPIGVETDSLQMHCYDLSKSYISLILSTDTDIYNTFVSSMIKTCYIKKEYEIIILDIANELKAPTECKCYNNLKEICEIINYLYDEALKRNIENHEAEEKNLELPVFKKQIIFINSISNLIEALETKGTTLEKLEAVLLKGKTKYNMNIIISEAVQKLSNLSYKEWYKHNVNTNNGIWIGAGITEQYHLNITIQNSEMKQFISNEYGYIIQKGRGTKFKTIDLIN